MIPIAKVYCLESLEDYGKFQIEPLEKGYGITLGSLLKYTLLNAIRGPAIEWIKIEGVRQSFDTLPQIKEELIELILNLRNIKFKLDTPGNYVLELNASKSGEVLASNFILPEGVKILNPQLHIATLIDGESGVMPQLNIKMGIGVGKGYIEASRHGFSEEDGSLPIDSLYSPVRKVEYTVKPARWGEFVDYDCLNLEIWVSGALSPYEVLVNAGEIVQAYLKGFILLSRVGMPVKKVPEEDDKLKIKIEELNLSVRAYNCLRRYGIETLGDLVSKTEEEIINFRNFGKKSLEEIKKKLLEYNLSFRDSSTGGG